MKKLPIGIQTFERLISEGYLYVDKTSQVHTLISSGSVYFLSRPRRFGKSLLLTTLKALFLGKRHLFKDLAIDSLEYDWAPHPVIHIDMSLGTCHSGNELREFLSRRVTQIAGEHGIRLKEPVCNERFAELIRRMSKNGKVVVLIDEYDKPILDNIPNVEIAIQMRDVLKGFYTVIKASDEYLRFVFLTGVSKFSRVSVFSGLNNLNDITMNDQFASMLGYTEKELEHNFSEHIDELVAASGGNRARMLQRIQDWYNGYQFGGYGARVYNPFSTLLLFRNQRFASYWFETGTPTFLVELIREGNVDVSALDDLRISESSFGTFDIERLDPLPLLVQTGYLTIRSYDPDSDLFQLGYPNREVRKAFLESLTEAFVVNVGKTAPSRLEDMVQALRNVNMEAFFDTLRIFFADIPYDIQIKRERYYQTIFYLVFSLMGIRIRAEVRTNRGRVDAVAETDGDVFIFEFKLDGSAADALAQIRAREYAEKYADSTKPVHLIGVVFDHAERNIGDWVIEDA